MTISKRGSSWRVRVKWHGVVVASKTFPRKREAEQWEAEQVRALHAGAFISPAAGSVTVHELADEYSRYRKDRVSERSWESDESALRVHIVPALGSWPVNAVTPVQLSNLLGSIATTRSPGTAARVRTTVRGLFAFAVESRRISVSPAVMVKAPRPDSGKRAASGIAPFTRPELFEVVQDQRAISTGKGVNVSKHAARYAEITLFLGLTGLRFGELRALRVRDVVQLPYPAVVVSRSHPQSARTGRIIERTRTKGGRSRLVPLVGEAHELVSRWSAGKDGDALLFPSPEGTYLRTGNWRRSVHWDDTARGRRPHDLRHTAATLWLRAGVDVKTVAAWLGHASTKLTLDTYGHWMGTDADRAAIARVEAAFRDEDARPHGDHTGTTRGENSGTGHAADDAQCV